ncbi:hypothetical protein PIB30_026677 [Stylosanthes scabra]|uniref:Uncharacterized protein n=1 Tax=Stylosanthes scabra TaxID=79078 RepID=A0ABU6QAX2_9FABA|nr:hypothetical protein [Stylosanthes scabra]
MKSSIMMTSTTKMNCYNYRRQGRRYSPTGYSGNVPFLSTPGPSTTDFTNGPAVAVGKIRLLKRCVAFKHLTVAATQTHNSPSLSTAPPPSLLCFSFLKLPFNIPSSALDSWLRALICAAAEGEIVAVCADFGHMTREDRGRGRGDRGRGSGDRRGRPKKRTGAQLDLGPVDPPPTQDTTTPPPSAVPTLSLSEGLSGMRMIPTPGSRPTHGDDADDDDALPPLESDPLPYSPVDNPLPESEEEGITAEEAAAAAARRVYLRSIGTEAPEHVVQFWWDNWRSCQEAQRVISRDTEEGALHGWIPLNLFDRLVEFWRQEDFKRLQRTNTKNRASETGGSINTGGSTTYLASRERMEAFEAEKNRREAERQAIIDAGGPEPPPIDEEAIWMQVAGGRKKGRIYCKGVVPAYSVPLIIRDIDDDDTASGPPDVKE